MRETGNKYNRFNQLHVYLERERNYLKKHLEMKQTEEANEKGDAFGKKGEASISSYNLEKGLELTEHTRKHLAEIEHALDKYEKGTYGKCDICGKDIPIARLRAIPQASICMQCKSKR